MRHAGQVLTRQQLLDHVWGIDYDGGSNVVEVYVGYLRRKLGRGVDRDRPRRRLPLRRLSAGVRRADQAGWPWSQPGGTLPGSRRSAIVAQRSAAETGPTNDAATTPSRSAITSVGTASMP